MMNRQPPGVNTEPVDQRVPFRRPEAELFRLYGSHSLAFFGLAEDCEQFLAPGEQGLIAYRVVNRVAVALGDPLCAPQAVEAVTRSFLAFCYAQGFRVAFYQARPEYLAIYHTLRLHAFKMGEEAMLFPQTFSLQGPALAKVRTRCRHAQRAGVQIQWYEGVLPATVMQQLASVSDAWLERKGGRQTEEMGFSTGKFHELLTSARQADQLAELTLPCSEAYPAPPLVTGVALTRSGQACAFVTFTPLYGGATGEKGAEHGWGWALDLMRRTVDAPSGAMDLLLVQAIERFRVQGAHRVSLALAALADTRQELAFPWRHLADVAARRLALFEHRQTLFAFKQKFDPFWESRYLVTSSRLAFPNIALAVLRLRHYSGRGCVRLLTREATLLTDGSPSSSKQREETTRARAMTFVKVSPIPVMGKPRPAPPGKRERTWPGEVGRGTRWQFLRYCLVGGVNTIIDVTVFNALLWCFPTHNIQLLVVENSVAYASGAVSSFFLNKYWTFQRKQRPTRREAGRFLLGVALELVLSNGLLWLAGRILSPFIANIPVWGNASKLLAVAVNAVLSYLIMRFWIFASGTPDRAIPPETSSADSRWKGSHEGISLPHGDRARNNQ